MLEDDPDAAFIAGADKDGPTPAPADPAPEPAASEPAAEPEAATEEPAEPETGRADGAEPEEGLEPEDEADKPRTPWFQKRINTLTREKHDADRRADAIQDQMRALLEAVQARQPETEGTEPPAQPQARLPGAPVPPANVPADQVLAEARRIVAEETFTRTCNEIYKQGATAFKGDWQGAVSTLGAALPAGITRDLVDAAIEAGDAHKLFFHLGKNPELAQEIAELPPARMAVRLTRIASEINKPPAPKPVSRAPAPVTPIGPGPTNTDKSPEDMTMDEFIRWDEDRQAKRRSR
jgi:hypothetical protein